MSDEEKVSTGTSNGASNGASGSNGVHVATPDPKKTRSSRRKKIVDAPAPTPTAETQTVETPPEPPPPAAASPVAPTAPISPRPWFRKIPQSIDIGAATPEGDGWEEHSSALLYSAEANGERPVQVLCTDVRMWGGIGEAIMCRSKSSTLARLADGEIYEVPAGVTFAVLAVNELVHIVTKLEANPESVVEAVFIPIGERRTEDGRLVMHYRVRSRIVKGLSRKDAWRG